MYNHYEVSVNMVHSSYYIASYYYCLKYKVFVMALNISLHYID